MTRIVNKACLYDQLMESGEPASARQTIPILVKYSRMMKDLLAETRRWFRQVEHPGECFNRVRPDRQPEPTTRWLEK